MKQFLLILLVVGSMGPHKSYADDSVKCINTPSEDEVFKLLSFVKNNVLGTVPKFCREKEPSQLSDQVDDSEKELSNFVSALKLIDPNEKNISRLTKDDFDETVIQTAKFIILKKIWAQSSESNQYDLLISKECGPLGLNRFPIHEKSKKITKGDSKAGYTKGIKVCSTDKMEALAPYLTKEVLAETLLNLRRIFPEDFPKMVSTLCDGIKKADESLLKSDGYANLLISEKPASAKSFSAWLKELYQKKYKSVGERFNLAYKSDPVYEIKYLKEDFDERQANLKLVYEALLQGDETLLKDKYQATNIYKKVTSSGGTIEKNPQGFFIMKKGPENNNPSKNDEGEEKLKMLEAQIAQSYEKEKKVEVPLKKGSAVIILKDEKGNLKYKIAEEDRQIILEKAKALKKIIDQKEKENFEGSYFQAIAKTKYDLQELLKGEEVTKPTVQKNLEGLYKSLPDQNALLNEQKYEKIIAKFGGDIAPDPLWYRYYVKINGEVVAVDYDKNSYKWELESAAETKRNKGSTLSEVLRDTYQNSSSDYEKIKDLPPEKLGALRAYTASGYQRINSCLRKGDCDTDLKKKTSDIVEVLKKAKVDNEESRILYRGTSELPPQVANSIKNNPKNFVLDKGFLSTSAEIKTAKAFASRVLFIIKSKNCVGISKVSNVQYEDEFLCPPGMKFNVKKKDEVDGRLVYVLEEAK